MPRGEGHAPAATRPIVKPADVGAQLQRQRGARIGPEVEPQRRVIVRPHRQRHVAGDRERLLQTLMLNVHLGAAHRPAGERPLGDVDVDAIFLPIAVEPVIAPVADVRVPIFEPRDARVPFLPHHRRLVKPVTAAAIQKPHLGIEVAPDLDDAREVAPGARLVPEPRAVRRRIAVGAGRGRCRAPPVDRPRVADADAASRPYTRFQFPACAVAMRCTAMTPMRERAASSRCSRTTEYAIAACVVARSVKICSAPTVKSPTRPVTRPPPRIETGWPRVSMPMRRVKNRSTACGVPAEKMPAFSRKNGRFSGKKSGKRVRLVRCSSTSTCAKSVLYVRSSVRLGVTPNLSSPPTSPRSRASGSTVKLRSTPARA